MCCGEYSAVAMRKIKSFGLRSDRCRVSRCGVDVKNPNSIGQWQKNPTGDGYYEYYYLESKISQGQGCCQTLDKNGIFMRFNCDWRRLGLWYSNERDCINQQFFRYSAEHNHRNPTDWGRRFDKSVNHAGGSPAANSTCQRNKTSCGQITIYFSP